MELQNAIEQDSTMLREYRNENQSEKNDSPTLSNLSDKEDKLLPDRALTNNLDCAICKSLLFLISLILNITLLTIEKG